MIWRPKQEQDLAGRLVICSLVILAWTLEPHRAGAQSTAAADRDKEKGAAPQTEYACDIEGLRSSRKAAQAELRQGKVENALARFRGNACHLDSKDNAFVIEWA
jgi:hypothetical protein